ncbi:hypothetical protein Taro_017246 [Colocasia esculenta]|uniref:Bulb-type lectin domain-containing protein n=1 Tax=Colocasia esculenta TaxID=4460 RepID=A0A843UN26_COLES|nr:hypothetical protein [Colocasia esculenta]
MATSSSDQQRPFLFLFLLSISAATALAQVPASQTFTYVNEGEVGPFITEYGDSYRRIPIFGAPYQLMWHNSTPGQFFVGIRLGLRRQEPFFRWVWDANRGRPVGENATLTLGTNGNLVLAEADGRVVWSTNTANKGVVGIRLLSSGNLVLHDRRGRFVWQSFDHPTDTLFPGQSLRLSGPTKLVSRKSETENAEGKYSMVLERRALTLYMDTSTKPLPYGQLLTFTSPANVTLTVEDEGNSAWNVILMLSTGGGKGLARPKYNATNSIVRLQIDGNLVVYTYNEQVDSEPTDRTLVYFSDNVRGVPGCELPSKCGSLGVCTDEMCVACPTPKGLLGWSEDCSPPKLGACKAGAANAAGYYKVVGVENFLTRFVKGKGPVKVDECKSKCSSDCKCLGFFYWEESSRCWLAPTLGTLSKVSNSSHVAYIKSN